MIDRRSSGVGSDMQSGARRNKVEVVAELSLDRRGYQRMPLAIDSAHSANVTRERAIVDEPRQRILR